MAATIDDFHSKFHSDFTEIASKLEPWQKLVFKHFVLASLKHIYHMYVIMTHEQRKLWSHEQEDWPAPEWYEGGRHKVYQHSSFIGEKDGMDKIVVELCNSAPNCEVMQQAYDLFHNYVFEMKNLNVSYEEIVNIGKKFLFIL